MFESYDMKKLGVTLRTIRESNNLTRHQVSMHLGLHTDSLRKIESGAVIPKYESLEMLSQLYRIDILNLFDDSIKIGQVKLSLSSVEGII